MKHAQWQTALALGCPGAFGGPEWTHKASEKSMAIDQRCATVVGGDCDSEDMDICGDKVRDSRCRFLEAIEEVELCPFAQNAT